ncbi:MAG: type II toxin-antitoxin system HicA family toxin [Thermodesulfobacteriota bacterium]
MPGRPLKLRELIKRLRRYGIVVMSERRCKGSEIILLKPLQEGSAGGPQYPVKNHGEGTEISIAVILKVLSRFVIDTDEFWK